MKKEQILKLLKMGIIIFAIIVAFEILFSIDAVTVALQGFFERMAGFGYLIFFLMQFLQVCFIPVPSYFITIAGIEIYRDTFGCVNLFGQQVNLFMFGITMLAYMTGVLVAYFVGLKWGKKAVLWAAGSEEDYEKWCNVFKKKRSLLIYFLTVLFPIFPDDILCYIAGSVKMNFAWYLFANFIGRSIGLFSFMFAFGGTNGPVELIVLSAVFVALIIAYLIVKYKYNPKIQKVSGELTDHYDPRTNTVSLSDSVYDSTSVASIGVATHEVGHALQYATNYKPVKLRMFMVGVSNLSLVILEPI